MIKHKSLSKLILFNFVYSFNFSLFWILFILSLISQPIIEIAIYFTQKYNMINYSLLMVLLPLVTSFIFILFQMVILFQDSKTNSIQYKLICSKYSKFKIIISRIISIFISLLVISLIQDIFLVFFLIINMMKFGLALFIANTFISPFIYLFIIFILVLLANKLGKVSFTILSIIIGIFTLGFSLISRPFIYTNQYNFDYSNSNNEYRYTRLVNDNQDNVLIIYEDNSDELNTYSEIINKMNKSNLVNNFIPSEWIMSFYSSLFSMFDFELNFNDSIFNLLSIKIMENFQLFKASDYLSYYALRPIDINFCNLSNEKYFYLIAKNINEIIKKYDLLNNQFLTSFIYNTITKYQNWNAIELENIDNYKIVINFLRDATGVNLNYNQLFYFIKYPNLIKEKIPNFFNYLKITYNNNISNLFEYVLTSKTTINNLFNVNNYYDEGVLGTNKNIDYYYPNIDTIVKNEKPSKIDIDFVKNKLLKFTVTNDNQIKLTYLKNDLTYSIDDNNLYKLNKYLQNIINYETWSQYIDSISTYNELNEFLFNLLHIFNDIYQYDLSNNTINIINSSGILLSIYSENIFFSKIFILFYLLIFIMLFFLIHKNTKHNVRKDNTKWQKNKRKF